MILNVKTETADLIRAAAPRFGMVAAPPVYIGPGLEALEVPETLGDYLTAKRRAAKVSLDVLLSRILKGA
jgi:hypothetical protein